MDRQAVWVRVVGASVALWRRSWRSSDRKLNRVRVPKKPTGRRVRRVSVQKVAEILGHVWSGRTGGRIKKRKTPTTRAPLRWGVDC